MDPKEAARATRFVHSKFAIPIHPGMTRRLAGAPAEYQAALGDTATTIIVMIPGETVSF
jgi:hypothetical protein